MDSREIIANGPRMEYNLEEQMEVNHASLPQPQSLMPLPPVWGRVLFEKIGKNNRNEFLSTIPREIGIKRMIEIRGTQFTFGRDKDNSYIEKLCDFVNHQETFNNISRHHFKIYKENLKKPYSEAFIEDMSTHGTWINGIPMEKGETRFISTGDMISVTDSKMVIFQYEDVNTDRPVLTKKDTEAELKKDYCLIHQIGEGKYGVVYAAYQKRESKLYAIKHIKKSSKRTYGNEIEIMKRLKHPCILNLAKIFSTSRTVDIVMEYCAGGDLVRRIRKEPKGYLAEYVSQCFFYQMIIAIRYMHCNGIVHRDIKPDNIFLLGLEEMTLLKVGDFGGSKILENNKYMTSVAGTLPYTAPEVLVKDVRYDKAVDFWSIAVLLYSMVSGFMAFSNHSGDSELSDRIRSVEYTFHGEMWESLPGPRDIIKKTLVRDPQKRMTIDDMLLHDWLSSENLGVRKAMELIKDYEEAINRGVQVKYNIG